MGVASLHRIVSGAGDCRSGTLPSSPQPNWPPRGSKPLRIWAVAGDAGAVAKAVERLAEAGADSVILQPTGDEPDPEGFVRRAAEEVRPLVP